MGRADPRAGSSHLTARRLGLLREKQKTFVAKRKKSRNEVFLNIPYDTKFEKTDPRVHRRNNCVPNGAARHAGNYRQHETLGKNSQVGTKLRVFGSRFVTRAAG